MVKILKKDGKVYFELPEELTDKEIAFIRLENGIYVVASKEAFNRLVERQLRYTINRKIIRRMAGKGSEQREGKKAPPTPALEKGFAILPDDETARAFAARHAEDFRAGRLKGVKGFDGKYYVVDSSTYAEALGKMEEVIRRGATIEEIVKATGLDKNLVKAVLEIAREEGVVYEGKDKRYRHAG